MWRSHSRGAPGYKTKKWASLTSFIRKSWIDRVAMPLYLHGYAIFPGKCTAIKFHPIEEHLLLSLCLANWDFQIWNQNNNGVIFKLIFDTHTQKLTQTHTHIINTNLNKTQITQDFCTPAFLLRRRGYSGALLLRHRKLPVQSEMRRNLSPFIRPCFLHASNSSCF